MYRKNKVSFIASLRISKKSVELTVPKRIVDLLQLEGYIAHRKEAGEKAFVNIDLEMLD